MGCEETDLFIRARQSFSFLHLALRSLWPGSDTESRPRRATFRYFVQRCYGEGKSKALDSSDASAPRAGSRASADTVLRVLPAGALRGRCSTCSFAAGPTAGPGRRNRDWARRDHGRLPRGDAFQIWVRRPSVASAESGSAT